MICEYLLVSDGLSLVKAPHPLFPLAPVDSLLVECETLDYLSDSPRIP